MFLLFKFLFREVVFVLHCVAAVVVEACFQLGLFVFEAADVGEGDEEVVVDGGAVKLGLLLYIADGDGAVIGDGATVKFFDAQEAAEKGGFAGSVGTDEAYDFTCGDGEGDIFK